MPFATRKQSLVGGSLFIIFGVMGLLQSFIDLSPWVWAGVLVVNGLWILAVYFTDRREWGFLIATYAQWAVALLIALVELNVLPGAFIALYILAAIAAPFVVVYLRNRQNWWALIPAYVLLAVGGVIVLAELDFLPGGLIATYILGAIALPFLVVYILHPKEWWPLIPAYVLTVIGVMIALIDLNLLTNLLVPAYILLAIALPFLVVYVRNPREWWTLIPGGILAVIGGAFLLGAGFAKYLGAAAMIIGGLVILLRQFISGRQDNRDEREI